nr:LrgB family protein [Porphyromonas pogonae]
MTSEVFMLGAVIGIYLLSIRLSKAVGTAIANPLLISIVVIIVLLKLWGIPYEQFLRSSHMLNFFLGPSVVSLGYILYKQVHHLKGNVLSIFASVLTGAFIGIVSIAVTGSLMGANHSLIASLEPKSVTTPIAMELAAKNGGIPPLTAVVVVAAGIMGSIIAPPLMRLLRIKSPIAKGLALGASSHGVGTATAIQMGAIEGALSGLAIGIMGIITALLLPLIEKCGAFL